MDPPGFHEHAMPGTLVSGGIAYAFIVAMAATSFDRTAAWVGPAAWRMQSVLYGARRRERTSSDMRA